MVKPKCVKYSISFFVEAEKIHLLEHEDKVVFSQKYQRCVVQWYPIHPFSNVLDRT